MMNIRHVHAKLDMLCIIACKCRLAILPLLFLYRMDDTFIQNIHSLTFHQKKTRLMVSGLSKNVYKHCEKQGIM